MNILEWLKNRGYRYTWDFKIGTKVPDLIAFNDKEIVVFEFKRRSAELPAAIGQCLFYRSKANKSYIALSSDEANRLSNSSLELLKKYGIGLISINETINIIIDSNFSQFEDKKLLKKLENRSIDSTTFSIRLSDKEIKQKIIGVLKDYQEGLHILGIARILRVHRHTVTKYIHELMGAGVLYQRDLGTIKLCYLSKGKGRLRK